MPVEVATTTRSAAREPQVFDAAPSSFCIGHAVNSWDIESLVKARGGHLSVDLWAFVSVDIAHAPFSPRAVMVDVRSPARRAPWWRGARLEAGVLGSVRMVEVTDANGRVVFRDQLSVETEVDMWKRIKSINEARVAVLAWLATRGATGAAAQQ